MPTVRFGNQTMPRESRFQCKKQCPQCARMHSWWEPSDTTQIQCPCGKLIYLKGRTANTNAQENE